MRIQPQKLFWNAYFKIYNALCNIRPYQKSIERGTELLAVKPGGKYLDLACGTGNSTSAIANRGGEVIGVDSSDAGIESAKSRYPGLKFAFGNFNERLAFENQSFDGVFSHNALYLARDPMFTLMEIFRVLKPGGIFVMSNPKEGANPLEILKEHFRLSYQKYLSESQSSFWAKLKMVPEVFNKSAVFMAFLPFQIALKSKGGGAANFWSREQWEALIGQLAVIGNNFIIAAVEPGYAGQNITFALKKE